MLKDSSSPTKANFICTLLTIFLIVGLKVKAQQQQQIFQTSPEAAALTKMVNYPVNFNTGVPNISIPLYEVQAGDIKIPIELSYHAGGFKIHEQATRVGLGWSLSSDIQITRTINGLDDLSPTGYMNNSKMKTYFTNMGSSNEYPFYDNTTGPFPTYNAYRMAAGEVDGMPDQFNYKLLNKSGSFYFRKNAAGTSYTIVPVPYDNIKITYDGKFTIIDTDGTTYVFGATGSPIHPDNVVSLASEISGASNDLHVTTWKCKTISNATKTEAIQFTYQAKAPMTFHTGTSSIDYYNNESPCGMSKYFRSDQITTANPSINSYEHLTSLYPFYSLSSPKYIENSSYGYAVFHLPYVNSTNQVVDKVYPLTDPISGGGTSSSGGTVYGISISRIDFRKGSVTFNGADALSSIQVKDSENAEIRSFSFFQSYAAPIDPTFARTMNGASFSGTRYLDSIQITANNVSYESYKLLYAEKYCFGNHIQGKDAWGYSNMYTSERSYADHSTSVPEQNNVQRFYKDANSFCAFVDNVNFRFGNSINVETPNQIALKRGVLKRIIYPTGGFVDFGYEANMYRQEVSPLLSLVGMSGGLRIKSINYFDGKTATPVTQKYYRYGDLEDGVGLVMNIPTRNYNPVKRDFDAYSYSQTIGYVTGPPDINAGNNFDPVPVGCINRSCLYFRFKEKKTTYLPASTVDYSFPDGAPIYYTKVTEYNHDLGVISGKRVHTFYKPNDFTPYFYLDMVKISGSNIDILQTNGLMGKEKLLEEFKYENRKYSLIYSKASNYIKRSEFEQIRVAYAFFGTIYKVIGGTYTGNQWELYNTNNAFASGSLFPSNEISYGQYSIQVGNLLLSSETEKWVKGVDTIKQTTSYTYDNPIYQQPNKQTISTSNGTHTKTFKYAYDFPGVAVYDQMTTKNMISQIIDVTLKEDNLNKEISRTVNNYGNISVGGGFIAPLALLTSRGGGVLDTIVSYNLYDSYGNVLQQKEKGSLIKSFIWGYGSKYPVAQIDNATYSSATVGINMTTFQALTTESQIRTILNGVRTSVPNAMVTSYTYKPLIGISSETAPNGKSRFYDYDPFGRLLTIKDQNLQITNKYDYKMTGPTSVNATSIFAYNTPVMFTYNKKCADSVNRLINVVRQGGNHSANDLINANIIAENYLEANWSTLAGAPDCTSPAANVLIQLNNWSDISKPTGTVYIDFIKDNSVVVSKKMPPINFSGQNLQFYIEPGVYQVSIRFNDNYAGALTHFEMFPSSGGGGLFTTGSTVNCQSGLQYTFVMYNN